MSRYTKSWIISVIALALGVLFLILSMPASAATEHCPNHEGNANKVESIVDGDLDNIVLDEGTVFCVKGSTTATGKLTADGETNLRTYLGINKNVSYYVTYEVSPSTTTTTAPTTTTTSIPTTTTTTVKETTTTNGEASTTTTNPQETTTSTPSSEEEVSSPTTTSPSSTVATLPYTGINDPLALGILGLLLLSVGGLILSATRNKE